VSILADLITYARFACGLRSFLRQRITLERARAIVRQRIAEREVDSLHLVERGILSYPQSPYLPSLMLARCEPRDIQNMGRGKALEDTLQCPRVEEKSV